MKILKIIPGFPTNIEPYRMKWIETYVNNLSDRVDLDIIVLDSIIHYMKPAFIFKMLKQRSLPIFRGDKKLHPLRYLSFPGYLFYKLLTLKEIERRFVNYIKTNSLNKYDLVHAHFSSPCGELALKMYEMFDIPYIITEHASNFKFLLDHSLKVYAVLTNASKVFCVAPTQKEEILKLINIDKDKIELMPMGVDTERYKPDGYSNNSDEIFKILFVGALIERKGAHVLIDALRDIKEIKNYKVQIVGDGVLEKSLKEKVDRYNLSSKVDFLGAKVGEDLVKAYQNCDLFVAPSLKESFGVTIVEALACGKPVISTFCGGPEWIINENNGLLAKPLDSCDLKDKIECFYRNRENFNENFIRDDLMSRFSQQTLISQQVKIYEQVI